MLSRVLGSGFILKKDGWLVSVRKQPSDQLPTVSVKRTARGKQKAEVVSLWKSFTLVKLYSILGEKNV
jgi:hypothetical protein